MLQKDERTGMSYDESRATERREVARQRKILDEIEAAYGPIDPATTESDKQVGHDALRVGESMERRVEGLVQVARCHWRRSIWSAGSAWRKHPNFDGYAAAYENTSLKEGHPAAWEAFRAMHPLRRSPLLAPGYSNWQVAKR